MTVGEKTTLKRLNESTYIIMGELHRLTNDSKISGVLTKALVGKYTRKIIS